MAKKVLDVLPPKEKKPTLFKKGIKEKTFGLQIFNLKKILIFLSFFLLILFFSFSSGASRIKIQIWPKTEIINFPLKVQLNKDFQSIDLEKKTIPAKIFEVEKTFAEEFPATGKTQKYAQGKIRLYNSFTTQQEVWREKTRFVSKEGKLFLSKNKIVVPGATIKNGKIIPSFVDVEVIAAEPGSDYNIGPTTFSVVAFRGTPRFDKYYGESKEPMVGGGEVSQVTKVDLENAEKILTERVEKEMEQVIKNEIPEGFVFLPETLKTEIVEKISLAKEGEEVEKFLFQIKARAITIAFKRENLENLLLEHISHQIPEDEEIFPKSLKINHSLEKIDFPSFNVTLSVDFSIQTFPKIDILNIKNILAGKSFREAKKFLEQQPEISKVKIISPFWARKIPKNLEKIELEYPIID